MKTDHKSYAAGLREMADWIEANPHIPLPNCYITNSSVDTKEDAEAILRSAGHCKKEYTDEFFHIRKSFGPVELDHLFYRKAVCRRVVVGVETIPATFVEAHTVPAQTKEIVEWECVPILGASDD